MRLFLKFLLLFLVASITCLPLKRDFADLFKSQLEFQREMLNQYNNMFNKMVDMNSKIHNQFANVQKNDFEEKIKQIDAGTFDEPTTINYNNKAYYFNGQYFTDGKNGPKLNEQDTKEAWAAMKNVFSKNIKNINNFLTIF